MFVRLLKRTRDKFFGIENIRNFVQKNNDNLVKSIDFRQREIKAMILLQEYFPDDFIPDTSFSMSYQEIQHILNDILIYKPRRILEFGTGVSTLLITNFLKKKSLDISFYSIDNDVNWVDFIKQYFTESESCIVFPFELKEGSEFALGNIGYWYGIPDNHLITRNSFDLIIVDGPFGGVCKHARYGALNFLKKFDLINEKSIVFIDDTNRLEERFLTDSLFSELGFTERKDFLRYSRLSFGDYCFTNPS